MKVGWATYPNNIGHVVLQGCFRCHDDNHKATTASDQTGLRVLPCDALEPNDACLTIARVNIAAALLSACAGHRVRGPPGRSRRRAADRHAAASGHGPAASAATGAAGAAGRLRRPGSLHDLPHRLRRLDQGVEARPGEEPAHAGGRAGCESCHGPGEAHINDPEKVKPMQFNKIAAKAGHRRPARRATTAARTRSGRAASTKRATCRASPATACTSRSRRRRS